MFVNKLPPVAKDIKDVLNILPAVKKIQLRIYIKKLHPNFSDKEFDNLISRMISNRTFFEPIEGYLSCVPVLKNNRDGVVSAVQFFWVYLALMNNEKLHFNIGRYPSDYVILTEDKVMEVIIFSSNGNVKLNYLKHMRVDPHDTIILIVMLNEDETSLTPAVIPEEEYRVISLYIDPTKGETVPKIKSSKGKKHE